VGGAKNILYQVTHRRSLTTISKGGCEIMIKFHQWYQKLAAERAIKSRKKNSMEEQVLE
jgi:hypothetical protein